MGKLKTSGFTLVELLVVITILAILGTIAYISLVGYTKDARNSIRISDMKLIEKSMSVFTSVQWFYPSPDSATDVTYSGSTVTTQWIFGSWVLGIVRGMSEAPLDPTLKLPYSYAVTSDRQQYQLGGVFEWGLFAQNNPVIPQTYAFEWSDFSGYTLGTYLDYARNVKVGSDCYMVTMPSLILWEIPVGAALLPSVEYKYVYISSPHLPAEYNSAFSSVSGAGGFEISEVWNSCNMDSLASLDLYIAQISTAYQPLSSVDRFEDIIFNSTTDSFRKNAADGLVLNDINVNQSIIKVLNSPPPEKFFNEDFTATNGTQLVWAHIPTSWSWSWQLESWSALAYTISLNALQKTDSSSTFVYPSPLPIIETANMRVSFDLVSFGGWDIFIYLRYMDVDNYYRAEINAAGYRIIQRVAWVDGVLENVAQTINPWSNISFEIEWSSPIFFIDNIELSRSPWSEILWIGRPIVDLQNPWASIDNYLLRYR